MVKTLPKIIYHGAKIFFKSIHKSILEEIHLSREAARVRYREKQTDITPTNLKQISLDEAMRILNVDKLDAEEVEKRYKHLFQANSKTQGGSFYLQSKIFRAKERIVVELNNNVALKNDLVNIPNK